MYVCIIEPFEEGKDEVLLGGSQGEWPGIEGSLEMNDKKGVHISRVPIEG